MNNITYVSEDSIVSNITDISKLPYTAVKQMVGYVYDELIGIMLSRKSIRIRGVGHLIVRRHKDGEWVCYVHSKPISNSKNTVTSKELVKTLATKYPMCPSPRTTYTSIWGLFCDIVREHLSRREAIKFRDIGQLQPRGSKPSESEFILSPLSQSKLEQQVFAEQLQNIDD